MLILLLEFFPAKNNILFVIRRINYLFSVNPVFFLLANQPDEKKLAKFFFLLVYIENPAIVLISFWEILEIIQVIILSCIRRDLIILAMIPIYIILLELQ